MAPLAGFQSEPPRNRPEKDQAPNFTNVPPARPDPALGGCFSGSDEWHAHLEALGIAGMKGPVTVATEGALRGTISASGRISGTVILSDDAGQFNVGDLHALCWVHAERNVGKLDGNTPYQHERVDAVLDRMWKLYRSLSRYRKRPTPLHKFVKEQRFDQLFGTVTGYISLDRLLERLKANKDELLRVLDHPETPLHTNHHSGWLGK